MENIFAWGRVVERIVIALSGALSITLGWHLFKIGVLSEQIAELSRAGTTIKLQKVGPGVFFSLFGASILIYGLISPLVLTPSQAVNTPGGGHPANYSVSYVGSTAQRQLEYVKALNTPLMIIRADTLDRIPTADLRDVLAANRILQDLRDGLIRERFGQDNLELWNKYGDRFAVNESNVPQDVLPALRGMRPWMEVRIRASAGGG